MPSVNTRRPRVSARPPAAKTQLKVYDTIPYPNDWPSWRDNLAIGKLPRADEYEVAPQSSTELSVRSGCHVAVLVFVGLRPSLE